MQRVVPKKTNLEVSLAVGLGFIRGFGVKPALVKVVLKAVVKAFPGSAWYGGDDWDKKNAWR